MPFLTKWCKPRDSIKSRHADCYCQHDRPDCFFEIFFDVQVNHYSQIGNSGCQDEYFYYAFDDHRRYYRHLGLECEIAQNDVH